MRRHLSRYACDLEWQQDMWRNSSQVSQALGRRVLFRSGTLSCIQINDDQWELTQFMRVQAEFAAKDRRLMGEE